jgi:hypothetical protein
LTNTTIKAKNGTGVKIETFRAVEQGDPLVSFIIQLVSGTAAGRGRKIHRRDKY